MLLVHMGETNQVIGAVKRIPLRTIVIFSMPLRKQENYFIFWNYTLTSHYTNYTPECMLHRFQHRWIFHNQTYYLKCKSCVLHYLRFYGKMLSIFSFFKQFFSIKNILWKYAMDLVKSYSLLPPPSSLSPQISLSQFHVFPFFSITLKSS